MKSAITIRVRAAELRAEGFASNLVAFGVVVFVLALAVVIMTHVH